MTIRRKVIPLSVVRFCRLPHRGHRNFGVEESALPTSICAPGNGPLWSALPRNRSTAIGACVTTSIDREIAKELGVREEQVAAAVALLNEGATVPFIARYRKEATGALDDSQLRPLNQRLPYFPQLDDPRILI